MSRRFSLLGQQLLPAALKKTGSHHCSVKTTPPEKADLLPLHTIVFQSQCQSTGGRDLCRIGAAAWNRRSSPRRYLACVLLAFIAWLSAVLADAECHVVVLVLVNAFDVNLSTWR